MRPTDPLSPEEEAEGDEPPASGKPDSEPAAPTAESSIETPPATEELTPEEQMKRYEDSLKDSDWGHQPC